jgi:hypothetical protein
MKKKDLSEPVYLKPRPISSQMEDDSIDENDEDTDIKQQCIIQERLNNLVKNVTNPTKIIEKITEKSYDDKSVNLKQPTIMGSGDLMGVLDYLKNNKGTITIKIEF